MKLLLLRHGATKGNLEKRYIGKTEEGLAEEGKQELLRRKAAGNYPKLDILFISPKIRCLETAEILYKGLEVQIVPELQECDFGIFEGKSYIELTGNKTYQTWIDGGGILSFPGGESLEDFKQRCIKGFQKIMKNKISPNKRIGIITHGNTIMALLEAFGYPKLGYYTWKIGNGNGYFCEYWKESNKIEVLKEI